MTEEEKKQLLASLLGNGCNIGQVNLGDGYQNCTINQQPVARQQAKAADTFEEAVVVEEAPHNLPAKLSTPKAMMYWAELQSHGFVDASYRRADMSRSQAMYIADIFADKVGIEHKWSVFQSIFGMNNLAQEKKNMQDTGNLPPRHEEIEQIFADK